VKSVGYKSALIINHNGIGNGIMVLPILGALGREWRLVSTNIMGFSPIGPGAVDYQSKEDNQSPLPGRGGSKTSVGDRSDLPLVFMGPNSRSPLEN